MDFFTSYARACAHCKAVSWQTNLLCKNCWGRLFSNSVYQTRYNLIEGALLPVHYMFNWSKKSDPIIKNFIYSLKGGGAMAALEKTIGCGYLNFSQLNPKNFRADHIVFPKKIVGGDFHAVDMSYVLKDIRGDSRAILEPLIINNQKQRGLSARERKSIKITHSISGASSKSYLFVDDLLTTGSTARAAWQALGKPKYFQAFCLAYRELVPIEQLGYAAPNEKDLFKSF